MNYIFTKARIFPQDTAGASAFDSLLVQSGKIVHLGTLAECRSLAKQQVEVIDLQGKALLPAFTDTHTHFTEYAKQALQLDLSGCHTMGEIRGRISSYLKNHTVLPAWILGGGWDRNRLDAPELLTAAFLDECFPTVPVALFSKDYHSRWCNSLALKLAGIGPDSNDPPGGRIERGKDGLPTGILQETASEALEKVFIPLSEQQTLELLGQAARELHQLGLTRVHSMETAQGGEVLEKFTRESSSLRVCRHFYLDELSAMIDRGQRSYQGDEWFKPGGVKIFADGSLGSQTAAMFSPYPDSAGNRGILRHSLEEIVGIASQAEERGIMPVIHAIGDRAVRTVIDACLELQKLHPTPHRLRRIEHVQAIAAEDIPRLKQCGAYCSLQPVHLANDVDMIEAHWQPVQERAYCFRSILSAGVPCGFGSDAPIETINPFHGIYSAITRKKGLDPLEPAWHPGQSITAEQAIYAYTQGAAGGSASEGQSGSLTPGKVADLIVLEDFTRLPEEYWLTARSLLTMLDGRIVWNKGI